VLVRGNERSLAGLPCERVVGDITDGATVDKLVEGADVVYHLAAKISLADQDADVLRVNVGGVRNLTDACLRRGTRRLVHFGSIHAFSPEPAAAVVDEQRALNTDDSRVPLYDRSKAAGQRVVLSAVERGLDAVILQPSAVIGSRDDQPSRMGRVLLALAKGRLPGLVEGGFSWVDVRDIVAAALAAEEKGRRGESYLLSGHWHSMRELATMAAEITGRAAPLFTAPLWLVRPFAPAALRAAELLGKEPLFTPATLHAVQNHRHTSHEKARRDLDFNPRPTRETLVDTYAWFRESGMLAR
jgi:dihydroflavonol-4-reductase